MVTLQTTPPEYVELDKWRIKIRPWMQNVLQVQFVLQDTAFSEVEKIDLCLWLMVRHRFFLRFLSYEKKAKLLEAIIQKIVSSGQKASGKRLMDFEQDAWAIYAAFVQAYGIDLHKTRLHWWTFLDLLRALPEDTRFSQIIGIRGQPLPKPTKYNADERRRIAQLKAEYALRPTGSNAVTKEEGLRKMAEMMMAMAEMR